MICANFKSWHQFTVRYLKFFVPVKYYNFQVGVFIFMTYFLLLCFNDVMCTEGGENLCFFDCLNWVYFSHLKLYSLLHTNIFHWTRNLSSNSHLI